MKLFQTTVQPRVAETVSGYPEHMLILHCSAYHMYIQEEINYSLISVNDGYRSLLSCVYSLLLKTVKMKIQFTCYLKWVCNLSFGLRQNFGTEC